MKIVKLFFSSLACVFTALGSCPGVAVAADNGFASLRASSTVPVNDNRIAALWSVTPSLDDSQQQREVPRVLFLGICLDFYYCLRRVLVPKFGFHFDRGSVSQALVKPRLVPP